MAAFLASVFSGLFSFLGGSFAAFGSFLAAMSVARWAALTAAVVALFAAVGPAIVAPLFLAVVTLFFFLLNAAVGVMPAAPAPPTTWDASSLGLFLANANYIFPIQELVSLGGLWIVVYSGLLGYKGFKFLRGGG
jgi:hypothetical protein